MENYYDIICRIFALDCIETVSASFITALVVAYLTSVFGEAAMDGKQLVFPTSKSSIKAKSGLVFFQIMCFHLIWRMIENEIIINQNYLTKG